MLVIFHNQNWEKGGDKATMGIKKIYVGASLPVVIQPSTFPLQEWETEAQRRGESVFFPPLIYLPNSFSSLGVGASVWADGDRPQSVLPHSLASYPPPRVLLECHKRGEKLRPRAEKWTD